MGGLMRRARVSKNLNFSLDDDERAHQGALQNWAKWSKDMQLDTMAFYRFLYPKDYYQESLPLDAVKSQISPYVVVNGVVQGIHLIWIDGVLTYAKQDQQNNNTIFGRRDRITYVNTLQGKYSLNNKINLSLSIRHYWSYVNNRNFLTLQNDGSLLENTSFNENKNYNLNLWNLDLSYSWWFAPGSQVSVLYRNNSSLFSREFSRQFESNFKDVIDNQNLNHLFSISVRYFIDYNTVKNSKLH
jgi:hypothetical protein